MINPTTSRVMDGWNYVVRLYQPSPQIPDGSRAFPAIERQQK